MGTCGKISRILVGFIGSVLCACCVTGYQAIHPVLREEGAMVDGCFISSNQFVCLDFMFVSTITILSTMTIVWGIVLLKCKPRKTSLMGYFSGSLGALAFSFQTTPTYFLGYIMLGSCVGGIAFPMFSLT